MTPTTARTIVKKERDIGIATAKESQNLTKTMDANNVESAGDNVRRNFDPEIIAQYGKILETLATMKEILESMATRIDNIADKKKEKRKEKMKKKSLQTKSDGIPDVLETDRKTTTRMKSPQIKRTSPE